LISRRNNDDFAFIEKAKNAGWRCYTSIHTLMELLDIAKDRRFLMKSVIDRWMDVSTFERGRRSQDLSESDLQEIYTDINNFFRTYQFIEFINLKDKDWDLVKEIGEKSNLHSSDVIHLATAWVGNCRVLVTHDDQLIREGNAILADSEVYNRLRVCNTIDAEKTLNE
jgi:predicted nucleic acid-binding protein